MSGLALAAAFLLACPSVPAAQLGRGPYNPNEVVCEMLPGYDIGVVNATYGTTTKGHQNQTDCYLLGVPAGRDAESLAVEIAARPDVLFCGLNYYLDAPEGLQRSQPFLDATLTGDYETQAAATTLNLPAVQPTSTGQGVRIALLDGGVNFSHPLFDSTDLISVYDYVDLDSLANDEPGGSASGHGTFVAGVLHLVAPEASLCVYRVLDPTGRGTGYDVASALLHATDAGCKVANLSLGMTGIDPALDQALAYAFTHGVFIAAAAGNDSTSDPEWFPVPASSPTCVAVAALDSVLRKADFSNYGPRIAFSAPGTRVYGPLLDSTYAWWDGTSFAAPFVSGTAAVVWAMDSALSLDDVDSLMARSAIAVDSLNPGLEGLLGHGLVNPAGCAQLYRWSRGGDVNLDAAVSASDAICLVNCVFRGGELPLFTGSGDVDCDQALTAADIIYLVRYIFLSGEAPCGVL